jgi:putative chitinase
MDMTIGDTDLIVKTCKDEGLLRNQAAYVLATALWETNRTMKPVKEAYWVKNAETWRKNNLRYWPWYGRGYVQLTWEANYIKAGKSLGLDLITDPDVVMEPGVSAKILVRGSKQGWFTGKRLDHYITLKRSNFRGARRIINGTDKAAEIAKIAKAYDKALLAKGYGVDDAQSPTKPTGLAAIIAALFAAFGKGTK